jgi:arginase
MAKNIQFIFNPSELGAGTRGASLGPEAIRAAARTQQKSIFKDYKVVSVPNQNELLDSPTPYKFAKYIDGLLSVFENLAVEIHSCSTRGVFPIIVSGDHSAAAGTLKALQKENPNKRIGVVWIDAHADIHSPYTTPSGNIHGMPIAAALGLNHEHLAKNQVDQSTLTLWNQLKSAAFNPQDLIYIGVRDTEKEEDKIISDLELKNYSVEELRQKGLQECLTEMTTKLGSCDLIYVSFDVDSIDPIETSYGTGTPVANGLLFAEAMHILNYFAQHPNLCAIEIVEVNPCLDDEKNKMAEHALALIENLITHRPN